MSRNMPRKKSPLYGVFSQAVHGENLTGSFCNGMRGTQGGLGNGFTVFSADFLPRCDISKRLRYEKQIKALHYLPFIITRNVA